MNLAEALSLVSSVAASIAAVVAYLGREAVSALQKERESDLRRIEESHKADLAKQAEDFKQTLAFFATVDTELRALRLKSYSELWRRTRVLPRWPFDASTTYGDMARYSETLRDWYFFFPEEAPGGMLLTQAAAKAYRTLQTELAEVLKVHDLAQTLSPEHYEAIRKLSSYLRTELTEDLVSRRTRSARA